MKTKEEQSRERFEQMQAEIAEREKPGSGRLKNYRYTLNDGRAWNPLLRWPRNAPCFCGSEKKFKRCCQSMLAVHVSTADAKRFDALMKRLGVGA